VKPVLQLIPHILEWSASALSSRGTTKATYPAWHVRDPLAGVGQTFPADPQLLGSFVVVGVHTWFKHTSPVKQPLSSPEAFELQPQADPVGSPAEFEEPEKHALPSEER